MARLCRLPRCSADLDDLGKKRTAAFCSSAHKAEFHRLADGEVSSAASAAFWRGYREIPRSRLRRASRPGAAPG